MHEHGLHIVTGAPGTGKTTVLHVLGEDVKRIGEPAREILAEQRAIAGRGTPEQDPRLFVELLLGRSIAQHRHARRSGRVCVFDRGVPDCVAYAEMLGVDPGPSLRASEEHRYEREVLLFEPWEDIYVTDDERTMSFPDVEHFHETLVDVYERTGYELRPVPRLSIEQRVAFVRSVVATPRPRR
jgi:predicted ATPase